MSLRVDIPVNNCIDPRGYDGSHRNSVSSNLSSRSLSTSPNESNMDYVSPNDEPQVQRRTSKMGRVSSFISKLYSMMEDGRYPSLISWSPDGMSFFVFNATSFADEVLPEHFKHSNFSSFVRLLNMYGFHKINKTARGLRGSDKNELWQFSHAMFRKDRPDLLKDIKRKAMDSELLRRETGDIHASFASLQMSQTDLLQQFYALQDDFGKLLQRFEQTKKVQLQQQIIIRQLLERQGDSASNASTDLSAYTDIKTESDCVHERHSVDTDAVAQQFKMLVTSPCDYSDQFSNLSGCWPIPMDIHSTHGHDFTMYPGSVSPSSAPLSPNLYETAINTPLPPSPLPELDASPIVMRRSDPMGQYHH